MSSVRDIARRMRVSVATVSRALNNHPEISAGTRDRVLKVIEQIDDKDGDPTSDRLSSPYLLFSSNLDGDVEAYLGTLCDSKDTYLKFRFADEGSEILVFDRQEMNRVTEEIMEENGIAPTRRGSQEALKAWKKGAAPSK